MDPWDNSVMILSVIFVAIAMACIAVMLGKRRKARAKEAEEQQNLAQMKEKVEGDSALKESNK